MQASLQQQSYGPGMGHGLEALLASAATAASFRAAYRANERDSDRWRSVLLESIDGGLLAEHDQQQQEEPEPEQASNSAAAPAQHWMQSLVTTLAGQQTSCPAAAARNIQWQRHMQRMLPLAAAAALSSAASSRSCSAGGHSTIAPLPCSIKGPSCAGSVSCPGSISSAAAETPSTVPSAAQRLRTTSSSSTCSYSSSHLPSSSSCGGHWELLPSATSSIHTGQLASDALPVELSEAAHLLAPGTGVPTWSTSESAAADLDEAEELGMLAATRIAEAGESTATCSDADADTLSQPEPQQLQELVLEPCPAGTEVGGEPSSAQNSPLRTPSEQRQHPFSFTLQCSSEQLGSPDRCSEQQEAGSSSWVAELPQQEGPCTSLLSRSSSSTADIDLEAASMAKPCSSSSGSMDMVYSLRTFAGATSQQECLSVHEAETSSATNSTAEQQHLQQQQEQLLQLLPLLLELQRLEVLASSLNQAEELSAAVQQRCSSLSSENSQLRSKEALTRAQARQLAVRHDACLSKLMQAQQQLEQQRLQLKASQRAASQRLQQLLQLVQAKQQQAVVCRTVSEEAGNSVAQQQQQQVEEKHAQHVIVADTQLQPETQQRQQQHQPAPAAEQEQQQQQPELAPEQEEEEELSCGVDWLWQLVSQLESSTLEVIDSREQDMAPLQQLQQQVQQLTLELQQATKAVEASAAEKQQLQRARDSLNLKLAECQRQLLQKHHDLSAVTNDRIAIAAGKTKLHHQLQDMQVQQQELELAGQQALEAAELNAQQADQLQQQLAVLQSALSAAESAKQKSDQDLKLAQSECENGLHQVAQLQLALQAANVQHSKALQDLQQQLGAAAEQKQQLRGQFVAAQAATSEQESKMSEQLKQLQQKLLAAGAAEGSSRQQVLQLQQQLDSSAAETKQLQQQLAAAKSVRDKSLQETEQLQQKLQVAAADKQWLQQQLSAAQAERITAQQQLVQVHQEAARLKQLLADAEASAAEMQEQLQASQQEVQVLHDHADLEDSQLVEALRAAQARIAGSTQQVVEAQLDVTQLAQVVELQQQQLLWQQDVIRKLRSAVPCAQLQVLLPDLDACSSVCTSPGLSPGPGTAAHSRAATPSRPMSPLVRPMSPCKPLQQQQQQQQQETISIRASTPDAASCGTPAAAAVDKTGSLQLSSFLMPQLTDDGAASYVAGNPLFVHPLAAAVEQLPASSLWGKDTAESTCAVSNSSDNSSSLQAVSLPASLKERASSVASITHVPMLPVDEGNAAQGGAAGGSSSSSKGTHKPGACDGQSCVQQTRQEGNKGTQRMGKRNSSTRISANGGSVVLARNKSQANAKNRNGTAGATTAAVAAAVARPRLVPDRLERQLQVPVIPTVLCDGSSSSIGADAAEVSNNGVGGPQASVEDARCGSWLWLQAPPASAALSDLSQICIAAKPSGGV